MSRATAPVSGSQKAAIVLMNMEPSKAALVMAQLSDSEAEEIAAEIVRLRKVDTAVAEQALAEFHELTQRTAVPRGGHDFATELLEASFGSERATNVMNRVASTLAGNAFEFLDDLQPGVIADLVADELPQTIAVVLAHLEPDAAVVAIERLEPAVRAEVAHAIAQLGGATAEGVRLLAEALRAAVAGAAGPQRREADRIGGVGSLIRIVGRADAATERALLEDLDERDPALAAQVRDGLLGFDDLVRFEPRSVQLVLRGIDVGVIALALVGASDALRSLVEANLSERNRELLADETALLTAPRPAQVEEARGRVVRALRDLDAAGSLLEKEAVDDGR